MSISVTPIPRLIDLAAPAFTLGTANAAGTAETAVASDSTLLVFDTTEPVAIGVAAVGTATVAPRRDHSHAGPTEATQAQVEAETAGTLYVPPDLVKHSPGVSKCWGSFDRAGSLNASYNTASITDNGAGDWTVNIATDFSSAEYAITPGFMGATSTAWLMVVEDQTQAAGTFDLNTILDDGTKGDPGGNGVMFYACYGDQS